MSYEKPENLPEFFSRLEAGIFPRGATADWEAPGDWVAFRAECEARELAGRDTFGTAYRDRDNRVEAMEECSDLAMYAWLDYLQQLERNGGDEDFALVLSAAHHGYLAHKAFQDLAAKRNGSP
jgi:hypothetical protein